MICSISGNIFVNRKSIIGFYFWTVGSLLWLIVAFHEKEWQQIIMFSVYTILNIEGIFKWKKKRGVII
jgi:nicotinamide riboside transporter PnuC